MRGFDCCRKVVVESSAMVRSHQNLNPRRPKFCRGRRPGTNARRPKRQEVTSFATSFAASFFFYTSCEKSD